MKFFTLAICSCALLLAAGCMTGDYKTSTVSGDDRVCLDDSLLFSLKPLEVITKIKDDGNLAVDASIEVSRTGFFTWILRGDPEITLSCRFEWIDDAGVSTSAAWKQVKALPGSIITFSGSAPAEKYVSFKLDVVVGAPPSEEAAKSAPARTERNDASAPAKATEKKATPIAAPAIVPAKSVKPGAKAAKPGADKAVKPAVKPAAKAVKPAVKPAAKVAKPSVKPEEKAAKPGADKAVKPVADKAAKPGAKKADVGNVVPATAPAGKTKDGKLAEPFN